MQVFHLTETNELAQDAVTPLLYGRYAVQVLPGGTLACDRHLFAIDADDPPAAGEKVLIWCDHDFFCCRVAEYETIYRH